jgi:hypothetical protein
VWRLGGDGGAVVMLACAQDLSTRLQADAEVLGNASGDVDLMERRVDLALGPALSVSTTSAQVGGPLAL